MWHAVRWHQPAALNSKSSSTTSSSVLLANVDSHKWRTPALGKGGRPKKVYTEEELAAKRVKAAQPAKKRGPKPTTSGDGLQLLDPEVLEEFRRKAAEEEALRAEQPSDPEADPARFNFHRVLMNAASRGLPDQAEETVGQLYEANLPPGPRAYHALVFSYVRAKLPYDALDAAKRAIEAGIGSLLPETYVILIFSLLNHTEEADVAEAQEVLVAFETQEEGKGNNAGAQAGWLMLCKELFRKGLIADAMRAVKKGYDERQYVSDPELAEHVVEQLTKAGLKDRAYQEVDTLVALGYRPGPKLYNHLIKAEAAAGAWRRARYLMLDAFNRPTWSPPNVDSFTSLLQGMVISVDPATGLPSGPEAELDEDRRLMDVTSASGPEDEGGAAAKSLLDQFNKLREESLLYGLRPNADSYAAMCAGYIKLRASDEALGMFQSMIDAGGSTRLLAKKKLSQLLITLAEEDRPADMLNVLKALVSANQPLPKSAGATLDHLVPGTTITTAWLPLHFDYMRAHPDDGTGFDTVQTSTKQMLEQATETIEFAGVKLSALGGCAVDEDYGGGVWLKPSKMSQEELYAELDHADVDVPEGAKRTTLAKLVKERREALSPKIKEIQKRLEERRKAELEALERKMGISLDSKKGSKKGGKKELKKFRVIHYEDGTVSKVQNVVQEVEKRRGGFTIERGGSDPYGLGDALGEDGSDKPAYDEDKDELSDILKEGVEEGVTAIVNNADDTAFGEEAPADPTQLSQTDRLEITIDHIEARMLNKTAGMRVAFEILRCVELLGLQPTGPDLEALVAGVVAESNADVALELSDRLPRLLNLGYSKEAVAGLYDELARICLGVLRPATADLVLERAENLDLNVDPALINMLNKALAGRPRHKQMVESEIEDLTDDTSTAALLTADDDAVDGDEEMPAITTLTPEDDDDEEDEEDGVYGRPAKKQAEEEKLEDPDQMALTEDPSWKADEEQALLPATGADMAPNTFALIEAAEAVGGISAETVVELDLATQIMLQESVLPLDPEELQEAKEAIRSELQAVDESEREALENRGDVKQILDADEDPEVVDLGDGVKLDRSVVDEIDAALQQGSSAAEALVKAGLLTEQQAREYEDLFGNPAAEDEGDNLDEHSAQVMQDLAAVLNEDFFKSMNEAMEQYQELEQKAVEGDEEAGASAAQLREQIDEQLNASLSAALGKSDMTDRDVRMMEDSMDSVIRDDARYERAVQEYYTQQAALEGEQAEDTIKRLTSSLGVEDDVAIQQIVDELATLNDQETILHQLAMLESGRRLSAPCPPAAALPQSDDEEQILEDDLDLDGLDEVADDDMDALLADDDMAAYLNEYDEEPAPPPPPSAGKKRATGRRI